MAVRRRPSASAEGTEGTTQSVRKSSRVERGWGSSSEGSSGVQEPKREGVRAPYLAVTKEKKIIRFLDDAPAVKFKRHYVNGKYQNCPESLGVLEGLTDAQGEPVRCPLCVKGASASNAYMINVLDISEGCNTDGTWETKTYTFGKEVHDQLLSFLEEDKYDPINQDKWYWHIFQVGGGNERKSTKILPLKARDVEEDYGIVPLSQDEIDEAAATVYDETSIFTPYVSALAKIAATLSD